MLSGVGMKEVDWSASHTIRAALFGTRWYEVITSMANALVKLCINAPAKLLRRDSFLGFGA